MDPIPDLASALRLLLVEATRTAVEEAVEAALRRALPELARQAARPEYLTRAEVVRLTGWSSRKLSYLQSQRRLPFLKRGRSVLFRYEDVEAFLAEGYVPATPPPSERRRAGDRSPVRGARRG